MHQPLAEEGLLIRRHKEPIDDNVIDKVGSHRAGIADIAHLDRRRPVGEDRSPAVRGITRQIDQDIDAVGMDQLGRPPVRHLADIDKAIKGADQARAHRAGVVRTAGIADDVEALPVVALDQSGDQKRDRMLAEIGGEIAEADFPARPRLLARQQIGLGDGDLGGNQASTGQLFLRRRLEGQQCPWSAERRLRPDRLSGSRLVIAIAGPIADIELFAKPGLPCIRVVRVELYRPLKASYGLAELSLLFEYIAEFAVRLGVRRVEIQ